MKKKEKFKRGMEIENIPAVWSAVMMRESWRRNECEAMVVLDEEFSFHYSLEIVVREYVITKGT